MKVRNIVVALALASSAATAQNVVVGGQLAIAPPVVTERTQPTDAFMRVQTGGGGLTLMAVESDGSITFNYAATVSFSRDTARVFRRAGPVKYFIPVYVGDELVLMPLYAPLRTKDGEADEQ